MQFGILYWHRAQINTITTAIADPAEEATTVAEYAERHPGAVSPIVLSLASKYEDFRPGYYWFGVYLLCIRLLQTSVLIFFNAPKVQAAFSAMVAFIAFCIQRELGPCVKKSDNAVHALAEFTLFCWLIALLFIHDGVLHRVPELLTGTILLLSLIHI